MQVSCTDLMTHKEDGSTISIIRNEGGDTMSDTISETATYMANAHRLGVSHFNKNMTRLTKDQFDLVVEGPIDLHAELYNIYGKGYRSVGERPSALPVVSNTKYGAK